MDYFASICLFLLCFLPSNVSFSLDAILFHKKIDGLRARLDFPIIRKYMGIFMCIAYFFSGFDKLLGYNWRNGESIWKTFTLPYSNLDFNLQLEWLADYPWVMIGMGWFVILQEIFYFLINHKPLRRFWLIGIVCMHLGIALILNLYFFSAIMIILNLTTYYDFEGKLKGFQTFGKSSELKPQS
ncbi:HTTM domain-containing protein [Croceitalea dokdonensis]|nr:HTTM domain-containing protein [Croceitalea dokdonensis]